ncbi:MAG TPA: hypothetical protein VL988_09630 [Solirubrobacteraceae bacterium]|nr:hypothetical protein [Solirubrobacteraceae bacterium]
MEHSPPPQPPAPPGSPEQDQAYGGHVPSPPRERGPWLLAGALALLGAGALAAALLFGSGSAQQRTSAPPIVARATPTPVPGAAATASVAGAAKQGTHAGSGSSGSGSGSGHGRAAAGRIVARPSAKEQQLDATRFVDQTQTHIARRWMEGFYPIYATAQRTFGVNWLLIASIHRQESAFSTAPDTYTGLNFAGCCGGPMQFNVTNGPVPTWRLVSDSFRYGRRPSSYDHQTAKHPSIYDDFDAIMAAAHLLSADGAAYALDGVAWGAAYDYYGHDATGVTYADQVLARAIGWSQHGFCINCGTETALIEAVHAAYGAPVLASLVKASAASVKRAR